MLRKYSVFAALLIFVLAVTWGIHAWRYRFVRDNQDLFRYLPAAAGTTLFVDLKLLRQGGMLGQIFAPKSVAQDPDYLEFIRETKFDYAQDLDTLAAKTGSATVLAARGRFDWGRLRSYALHHGGSCAGATCRVGLGKNARRIVFGEVQPDVLQLSTENLPDASAKQLPQMPSSDPVWMEPGPKVLADSAELPLPMRILAISLGQASPVLLSLGTAAEGSGSAFVLKMTAQLPNAATADTVRKQLELQTQMLALELKREKQAPDKANLTGLITAGSFENEGKTVRGTWPVRQELIQALQ